MGQHAQRRVHRPAARGQGRDGDGHGQRHGQRAKAHRQVGGQRQRHAQDGGMGRGIAEIGHAPPDDEDPSGPVASDRPMPGKGGAGQEIVKHGRARALVVG
jgi:hypothetical protein